MDILDFINSGGIKVYVTPCFQAQEMLIKNNTSRIDRNVKDIRDATWFQ